jgi:hypothetical protein
LRLLFGDIEAPITVARRLWPIATPSRFDPSSEQQIETAEREESLKVIVVVCDIAGLVAGNAIEGFYCGSRTIRLEHEPPPHALSQFP